MSSQFKTIPTLHGYGKVIETSNVFLLFTPWKSISIGKNWEGRNAQWKSRLVSGSRHPPHSTVDNTGEYTGSQVAVNDEEYAPVCIVLFRASERLWLSREIEDVKDNAMLPDKNVHGTLNRCLKNGECFLEGKRGTNEMWRGYYRTHRHLRWIKTGYKWVFLSLTANYTTLICLREVNESE